MSTGWTKGGRGLKRGSFNPQAVLYSESVSMRRRRKLSSNCVAMDKADYIYHFCNVVPPSKRLTEADAHLAWARDINPENTDVEKDSVFCEGCKRMRKHYIEF